MGLSINIACNMGLTEMEIPGGGGGEYWRVNISRTLLLLESREFEVQWGVPNSVQHPKQYMRAHRAVER